MDEKDYQIMKALWETKNITKAAEMLYITQSALSKRIFNMEEELNQNLLIRYRTGVHFTPAGERVLQYCLEGMDRLRHMQADLEQITAEVSGTLNAAYSINFSMYVLPEILYDYHQMYPKVNLEISTGQSRDLYKNLVNRVLDVAILRGEYAWNGLRMQINQEKLCVVYANEYQDTPLTDSIQETEIKNWMNEKGILAAQHANIRTDSIVSSLEMVRLGLGWSIIPEIALRDFKGTIHPCVMNDGRTLVRNTYLFCQPETEDLPQVKAFIDAVQTHIKETPKLRLSD